MRIVPRRSSTPPLSSSDGRAVSVTRPAAPSRWLAPVLVLSLLLTAAAASPAEGQTPDRGKPFSQQLSDASAQFDANRDAVRANMGRSAGGATPPSAQPPAAQAPSDGAGSAVSPTVPGPSGDRVPPVPQLPGRAQAPDGRGPGALPGQSQRPELPDLSGPRRRYIVQFAPGVSPSERGRELAASFNGRVERSFTRVIPAVVMELPDAAVSQLRRNPNVVVVEEDRTVQAFSTQTNPTWGLDRIDQRALPLDARYTAPSPASGVKVFVVDTGVRADHVDFSGRVTAGFTAINDGRGSADCNGHGTHVAGTAAGVSFGAAKAATIVPVRVLDCSGSGSISGVIAGLDWITSQLDGSPAVVNMSLGGSPSSTLDAAVRNVISRGVTVVVAAGNSNTDACNTSPARVSEAVTVAASDRSDVRASFSNFGRCVDIFAPGVSIPSAWHTSPTASTQLSGTSMAAPHAAGAVAMLVALEPGLSPAAVESRLTSSATTGTLSAIGSGSPDRLLYVTQTTSEPAPAPTPEPAPEPSPQPTPGDEPVPSDPAEDPAEDPGEEPAPEPDGSVPALPDAPRASERNLQATVTWKLPASVDAPVTSQTLRVWRNGTLHHSVTVSATATSAKVKLDAGAAYRFDVAATNRWGQGEFSPLSNEVRTAEPKRSRASQRVAESFARLFARLFGS
jgi:subtilisin family serine protease